MRTLEIAAAGFALILCASCQTREIRGTSSGGTVVFEDDFERDSPGSNWHRGTGEAGNGKWEIKDGWLSARNIKNDPLWLTKPLPEDVRVEFTARSLTSTGDLKFEIFGDGEHHESGYVVIFGGWNNSLDVIARLDEHGDDRKAQKSAGVIPDKEYRIAVERTAGELKWFVDDQLLMNYPDSKPLEGPEHAHFAFNDWVAPVQFDDLKVIDLSK